MATRRTPLIDNPNAANSPLRNMPKTMKQRRLMATAAVLGESGHFQQPPLKKQVLDDRTGISRSSRQAPPAPHQTRRDYVEQETANVQGYSEKEKETILQWQRQNRARFPNMVFFFESVPADVKERLLSDVHKLGAREVKFFSNDVTHVVTGRPIPVYQPPATDSAASASAEQLQTINPNLLERGTQDVHRRLFADLPSKPKVTRSADILIRAQEMGKRVYSVDKLYRILVDLLEVDVYAAPKPQSRTAGTANIDQMIESERIARAYGLEKGSGEMHFLRGPYIYVYDMQERYKPIMAREYAPVADRRDGDWPQFRSVANGRCPFVEDADAQASREARAQKLKEKEREARAAKAALAISAPKLRPSRDPSPSTSTPSTRLSCYLLTEDRANGLRIEKMTDDYLNVTENTFLWPDHVEAPAMVKKDGVYFMFGSHLSGWDPNDNIYSTSTSISSGWSNWTNFAPAGQKTYTSQTTSVLEVDGQYMYLGDRWISSDLEASTYVWLPLEISGTTASMPNNFVNWNPNVGSGNFSSGTAETSYEAENATAANGAKAVTCNACSGSSAMGYIGGTDGGSVTIDNVTVQTPGVSTLRIKYYNGDSTPRYANVTVNGVGGMYEFIPSHGVSQSLALTTTLSSTNTIVIEGSGENLWGPDIDRIIVPQE